jgi:putative membrane protein
LRSRLATTAVITLAVYGLLGVVLSTPPPASLPPGVRAVLGGVPLLIALINAATLGFLLAGWRAIRAGRIDAHRRAMLTAAGGISLFLFLYVTRVALSGVKPFPGPAAVRTYVYLPVLTVHIALSILSVPLVIHNLLTGLGLPRRDLVRTWHPRVGRWAVGLWSVSLALGILVFLLLNVLY